MGEFVLIVGLFIVAYRLRRATRPPRELTYSVEVHHYHHFEPDPGERMPEMSDDRDMDVAASNVVRLKRRGGGGYES